MSKLFITNSHIEIKPESMEDHAIASTIPYIHAGRNRKYYRTSLLNINYVLKKFRGITVNDLADKTPLSAAIKVLDSYLKTQELIKTGPKCKSDWLMTHQQLACEIAQTNPRFAFFYDTRT